MNPSDDPVFDPTAPPSGPGCAECLEHGTWWFHLRRCASCGHVGCCDSSPNQHSRKHARHAGHPVAQSYEPGEDWFWDYFRERPVDGPQLLAPRHHPIEQPVPGPAGRVPHNWMDLLN